MYKFKPKSFHLQWHITEKCNLHCKHCYQNPHFLKEELSLEELSNILNDFIKQIKKWNLPKERVKISITGGEPLVRKDFFDLLEKLHQNQTLFQYGILTNGTFLNEKNIKKLEEFGLDYLQISLEGMEKVNDSIRGKGVFKKAICATNLLKNSEIRTNFSMTVTKINLKEIPKVINLSKEMGVSLGLRRCVSQGSGKKLEKFNLSPNEVRALWHYILNLKGKYAVSLGCEDGMMVQDFPNYQPSGPCSTGYLSFTVLPNGDVYPCRRLPILAGNLLKKSFEEIYYNSEVLKSLRNYNNINDECYKCSHYNKCLGGAKCMAFGHFKDFSAPDPHCWRLFKTLPNPKLKWNSNNRKGVKINDRWVDLNY